EEGVRSYSQLDLDQAFAIREDPWENHDDTEAMFRETVSMLQHLVSGETGAWLSRSRLKNQADFYSLFAAFNELSRERFNFAIPQIQQRLRDFLNAVENLSAFAGVPEIAGYFEAARSASNDPGPRSTRIAIIKSVVRGDLESKLSGAV